MKKSLLISLLAALSSVLFAGSAFAAYFPDVDENHPNYKAIEYLRTNGIIDGYEDGTFGPDDEVNRAQAAKIITNAFGVSIDGEYEILFPDVVSSDWFFPYVMGGKAAGIIHGYEDGSFKPADTVNLAEALKIMVLAGDVELVDEVGELVFADVPQNEWYSPHAYYAREHNVLLGDGEGKVYPSEAMTRARFSEIIYRLKVVLDSGEAPFPIQNSWPLYESSTLPFAMKYNSGTWKLIENDDEVVFFKPDLSFNQFSPARIYPDTAVVRVTVDGNSEGLSSAAYFANIREVFAGANFTDFTYNGASALEVLQASSRAVDWYLYLDDGRVVVIYTEYGNGVLKFQSPKVIQAMLSSLEFRDVDGINYEEILSTILENVLVEGKGLELIGLLPDAVIFETDTIGVGTGPVDYYYSNGLSRTLKYERSKDVILDTREGKTSAF